MAFGRDANIISFSSGSQNATKLCTYRFSITKWIHLNEGDEGIRKLFQRAFETLRTGGVLVVEPQEWETYAKARRMDAVSSSFMSTQLNLSCLDYLKCALINFFFGAMLCTCGFAT